MTVVTRPDLSTRTSLSKSALQTFDLCQSKAWHSIHDPRPFVPNEKTTFGSAVDAGVEKVIEFVRSGQPVLIPVAMEAAAIAIERDGVAVDLEEVERAIRRFETDVAPNHDFRYCRLQDHVNEQIVDLGEVDGHPDIILANHEVWDVKTAGRAKAAEPPLELGIYALLVEAETGALVPQVGYFCWVRVGKPYWQTIAYEVTPEYRRWTYERVAAFVRAKRADEVLNRKAERPVNFSMSGAPAFRGLCDDCPWNPALGGPCAIAYRGESSDAA